MLESVLEAQFGLMFALNLALLVVKLFAFISALMFEARAYEAAGKLTKTAWTLITGIGVAVALVGLGGIINLAFTIAALVFILDVRPALKGLYRR